MSKSTIVKELGCEKLDRELLENLFGECRRYLWKLTLSEAIDELHNENPLPVRVQNGAVEL